MQQKNQSMTIWRWSVICRCTRTLTLQRHPDTANTQSYVYYIHFDAYHYCFASTHQRNSSSDLAYFPKCKISQQLQDEYTDNLCNSCCIYLCTSSASVFYLRHVGSAPQWENCCDCRAIECHCFIHVSWRNSRSSATTKWNVKAWAFEIIFIEWKGYAWRSFVDISGFTAWSSVRDPTQVFSLLEALYKVFDSMAIRRRVFKVETVGDCYVAVTGLPEPQKDHYYGKICKRYNEHYGESYERARTQKSIR